MPGDSRGRRLELGPKSVIGSECTRDEFFYRGFPIFIRLNPAAIDLCLFNGLEHVSLDSLYIPLVDLFSRKWPGTQEGLIDQVFFVQARRRVAFEIALPR